VLLLHVRQQLPKVPSANLVGGQFPNPCTAIVYCGTGHDLMEVARRRALKSRECVDSGAELSIHRQLLDCASRQRKPSERSTQVFTPPILKQEATEIPAA